MALATTAAVAAIPLMPPTPLPSFEAIYEEHFDFVWRTLFHLGVPRSSLDDAVQDVFVVVHRRLGDFEARSTLRTWIFGIARRVVRDHRESTRERPAESAPEPASDESGSPFELVARAQAARALTALLARLDDEKREAFVLAEIEELPVPEVAEALGINLNTAYARVRAARLALERELTRLHAKERLG